MRSNRSATDQRGAGAISIVLIAQSSIACNRCDGHVAGLDRHGSSIPNVRISGARRHQNLFWGQTAPKIRAGQVMLEASVTMVSVSAKQAYGGVAADERRAIRRAALMEAALDLFAEDGARGVSKRAICARARLNDRYFYEHFTDADAVVEAIVQDRTARGLEAVNVASQKAAPDIHAQVQETAVAALDFLTSDPRLVQLLLRSHTSEVLQQARRESARAIARAMAAMINNPPTSNHRRTGLRDGCIRTCEWSDGSHRRLATRGVRRKSRSHCRRRRRFVVEDRGPFCRAIRRTSATEVNRISPLAVRRARRLKL